ncbi:MAG TPA: M36 family metallopeptidase [Methylomirabilota bacterium]|nr:M36 family metallopeptidase [Methylomirabilota bacterium]
MQKALREEQRGAHTKLKQLAPGVTADFEPLLGTPKWVHAGGGFLTGENGEGRTVSADTAKRFERDSHKALKGFLHEQRALFRHGPEVLDNSIKRRDHRGEHGLRTVVWEQQVDGIPVFDSVLVAHTTARGELISLSSQFLPEPERAADRGTPNRVAKAHAPTISAERALRSAAENVGEEIAELSAVEAKTPQKTRGQQFTAKPLPGEASASLVWLPLDGDTLRLCWEVELNRREFAERFRFVIDAETGEVIVRRKLTVEVSEVLYRVYTSDSPSPLSPGPAFPTNIQPPHVPRSLLSISNIVPTASPLGWIADGVMETRGNNVDAHLDRDDDDRPDLPRVQGTITNWVDGAVTNSQRIFDFPIDFTQSPTNYGAASVVQLFYWCNFMHDKLYELGFTEGVGNFQKDNFGRGGEGNDPVMANAQDGSGFNNANYTPSRDGSSPKIQMYIFNSMTPARDGDLDAEVICHEYAHGLSDRLVGGGVGIVNLQSWGMGEGWSDFFAEALLSEFEDDLGGNYAVGGYVTYQFSGLTQNYYYGIRRYPYSTNMNVNPLTFKDIDPSVASPHIGIPKNPIITSGAAEVHRQGEVWCSMLWEMRAYLLRKYAPTNATDFTNANMRVLRYVTLGLQLSPPNPNFLQARDSIFLAVRALGGGSDTNEIWKAFARRGLGLSAVCPDSSTTFGVIEAYDTPQQPEFDAQPRDFVIFSGPFGGPFSFTNVITTLTNSSPSNLTWAAGITVASFNGVPWLQLSPTSGVLAPGSGVDVTASLTPGAATLPAGQAYQGTIYFTNLVRTQFVSRPVSLVVQTIGEVVDSLEVTPLDTFAIQGLMGGPFRPARKTYTLSNNGDVPLNWRASTTNEWLSVSPTSGTIGGGPNIAQVEIVLTANASALSNGLYAGAVSFMNLNSGFQTNVAVSLHVGPDYFTEDFSRKALDLQFSTMTFAPDVSSNFYSVCREPATQFPIDPTNGTPLTLLDDEYQQVTLTNGRQVSVYGVSSNAIYIGANGNVSFDPGPLPTNYSPSLNAYFAYGRAAPLYSDLNPERGGTVSYLQLEDRFVVTWENVPEYGTTNLNSVQLELLFNGVIRMTWLHVQIDDPLDPFYFVGLSRGDGMPPDFASSDLSAYDSCSVGAFVLLPLRAREGDPVVGTVLLGAPATNDLIVTLSSEQTNEVIFPETAILIREGQISVQFEVDLIDDHIADGTQLATITASFPDRASGSTTILVDDLQQGFFFIALPEQAREGDVLVGEGQIVLTNAVIRPLTVNLSSLNPDRVLVPSFVIIPPGGNAAHFNLVFPDNGHIEETTEVKIRASVPGWNARVGVIYVSDNESRALNLRLPEQVTEGQGPVFGIASVSLGGISPTNVVVTLQSENPALISVPHSVTNTSGSTNVSFTVTVLNNEVTNGFDSVRIFASAPGFISATGKVMVVDDERPFEPTSPSPAHLATHVRRNTALSWSANANATPSTIYDIYFGTNSDLFINSPIATTTERTVALPRHLDPETTYYWQVVARLQPFPPVASPVWQFRTAVLGFAFDPIASPQFVGEPFPISIRVRDEWGLAVTNYSGSLTLTNFAPVKSSATIVITEVETTGLRAAEFANVSSNSINIAGWKIYLYDSIGWPAPSVAFTIPSPSLSLPGEPFIIRSLPTTFFPGTYPNYATGTNVAWNDNVNGNPVAVLLADNVGNIVDFVCASGADPALISIPTPVSPEQWIGPALSANTVPGLTYQRFGNRDSNGRSDWRYSGRSPRTNNVDLLMPFTNVTTVAFAATPLNNFHGGTCTGSVTVFGPAFGLTFGATDAQSRGAVANPIDVYARNDIALAVSSPGTALVGEPITYRFTITNSGPSAATSVRLIDGISSNAQFTAAIPSQGSCSVSNNRVVCDFGTVAAGTIVTASVTASASSRGTVTSVATLTRGEVDGYMPNNNVTVIISAAYPQVAIFDATANEADITGTMNFLVLLSAPSSRTSSVAFATSDRTATTALDYQPASGVLVFPPGVTNRTLSVLLYNESLSEENETFSVSLFNPTDLDVTRHVALGTIVNDDASPLLSVSHVTIVEGDSGTGHAMFEVRLSAPSGRTVNVGYATAGVTALAGLDYADTYGLLIFPPGVTNLSIAVPIFGDTTPEPTKTFFLNLANAGNAALLQAQAVGTILDNDVAPITGFVFGPVSPTNHAGSASLVTITALDGTGAIATNFNDFVTLFASTLPGTISIGTNNTTWALPLGASFHDARVQSIYLTNEIGPSGTIVGLFLDVSVPPAQILSNFTIRLRHTPRDRYFSGEWETSGWVTNCQRDLSIPSTGWVYFPFSTPFIYNGRENIMVDFSFDNSQFSADGLSRSSATPTLRSLSLRTDSAYGPPLDWPLDEINTKPTGQLAARIPNLRLLVGDSVGVQNLGSNAFVNGVWSGTVSVTNAAENVVLRAVDAAGHFGESAPFSALRLKMEDVTRAGDGLSLRFATFMGNLYMVQTRSNLDGPWTDALPNPVIGDGTVHEFTDTPVSTVRFYRVVLLGP